MTAEDTEKMMITIRDFEQSDAMRVNVVAVAAFQQFSGDYADWRAMRDGVSRMSEIDGELIVAERDGLIIGAVAYVGPGVKKLSYFDQSWPIIRMLVVDPASRGLGAGRALTDDCIRRARRDGALVVALHTTPIMTVALPMYQRMGFVRQGGEDIMINGVPYAVYLKELA
jgi:ribosomal protein S18 acetylase RimI-like enzyme